jgi:hypothetical protein
VPSAPRSPKPPPESLSKQLSGGIGIGLVLLTLLLGKAPDLMRSLLRKAPPAQPEAVQQPDDEKPDKADPRKRRRDREQLAPRANEVQERARP